MNHNDFDWIMKCRRQERNRQWACTALIAATIIGFGVWLHCGMPMP